MRYALIALTAVLTALPLQAQNAAQNVAQDAVQDAARPAVSEPPYAAMQKLAPLAGRWRTVTENTNDGGKTWQASQAAEVIVVIKHKGLLMAEVPISPTASGFNMETYITYDQYRGVYRKAAIDDVWGIMDLYEGVLDGDQLVFTNLKSGTFFPVGEGRWRAFRLTVEIKTPKRQIAIEASDDGGKNWFPAFRVLYERAD